MGYNPQESLKNTTNIMGTLLGVHPIVPWESLKPPRYTNLNWCISWNSEPSTEVFQPVWFFKRWWLELPHWTNPNLPKKCASHRIRMNLVHVLLRSPRLNWTPPTKIEVFGVSAAKGCFLFASWWLNQPIPKILLVKLDHVPKVWG